MTAHAFPVSPDTNQRSGACLTPQPFPPEAVTILYQPARSAMTSGRARTHDWKLRFERRTPPIIEPLMGWTSGDDTLSQIELSFPSLESAIAYARRQGLAYTVSGMTQGPPEQRMISSARTAQRVEAAARHRRLKWVEQTLGPDVIQHGLSAGADPAEQYADPKDVLSDARLTKDQKRHMLQRWALDAYQLDLAFSRLSSEPYVSRLQEVIDALLKLDRRVEDGSGEVPKEPTTCGSEPTIRPEAKVPSRSMQDDSRN